MTHEILENGKGSSLDIDISPVHPRVIRAQSSAEQPVSGLGHELSAAGLGGEAVATLDVLVDLLSKVLFNDGNLAIRLARVLVGLDLVEVVDEELEGVVLGVGDQEREVNQAVRVGKVAQVRKEHGQMGRGVTQGHAEKNALLPLPPASGASDVVEVIVPYRLEVEVGVAAEEAQRKDGTHRHGGAREQAQDRDEDGGNGDSDKELSAATVGGGRSARLESVRGATVVVSGCGAKGGGSQQALPQIESCVNAGAGRTGLPVG